MHADRGSSRLRTTAGLAWSRTTTKRLVGARLAAEQSNNTGQFVLGTLYMNGYGVEQDFVSAYVWLTIARDNGVAGGLRLLDFLTDRLTPEQLEEARSRVRDWTRR